MMMYRKDLFAKAGLTMPEQPTWDFVKTAAAKITDPATETYGICLRGKAGWGENMAFLTTLGQCLRRAAGSTSSGSRSSTGRNGRPRSPSMST